MVRHQTPIWDSHLGMKRWSWSAGQHSSKSACKADACYPFCLKLSLWAWRPKLPICLHKLASLLSFPLSFAFCNFLQHFALPLPLNFCTWHSLSLMLFLCYLASFKIHLKVSVLQQEFLEFHNRAISYWTHSRLPAPFLCGIYHCLQSYTCVLSVSLLSPHCVSST